MFGLGFSEMLLLGAIALIAVGPKQLPEVARTLGRFLNDMKRATGDFTKTFADVQETTRSTLNETRKSMNDVFSGVASGITEPYTPPPTASQEPPAIPGFEPNAQGSLFVPTDLSTAHSDPNSDSNSLSAADKLAEEQLEFRLTSFNDDSGRSGKDS